MIFQLRHDLFNIIKEFRIQNDRLSRRETRIMHNVQVFRERISGEKSGQR